MDMFWLGVFGLGLVGGVIMYSAFRDARKRRREAEERMHRLVMTQREAAEGYARAMGRVIQRQAPSGSKASPVARDEGKRKPSYDNTAFVPAPSWGLDSFQAEPSSSLTSHSSDSSFSDAFSGGSSGGAGGGASWDSGSSCGSTDSGSSSSSDFGSSSCASGGSFESGGSFGS